MADYDRLCVLMDSCKRVGYVRESAMLNGVLCRKCAFYRDETTGKWCELTEVSVNPGMFCSRFVDKMVERSNGR